MIPFIFVTQSSDKLSEVERILGFALERYDIDLPEIQSVDVEEVVIYKVKRAYAEVQRPVMIEDSGLFIEAWNGLPGALIKWFLQRVGTEGVCRMLHDFPNRSAWAKTVVATYDGVTEPRIFVGEIKGQIAVVPAGNGGFGWDAIFVPNGSVKTFGEMQLEEKNRFSMRRRAFEALKAHNSPSTF